MKKIFILSAILSLVSIHLKAKDVTDNESFLSGMQYTISVGYLTRASNEPFDNAKAGFTFGVDAKKNITSHFDNRINTYGLLGLHFVQKGGNQSNDIMDMMFEDDNSFSVSQLSIPIHYGAKYNLKKCSFFLDLGPYLAFKISGNNSENLNSKAIDLGIGLNFGVKFKKIGIGVGWDKGFTKIGEYRETTEKTTSLKGTAAYFCLQWTFGE